MRQFRPTMLSIRLNKLDMKVIKIYFKFNGVQFANFFFETMTSKVLSLLFVFHQFPLICANTISLYKYLVVVLKRYIIKGKNILYSIQRIIIAIAIAHATNCILFLLSLPAKIYLRTKLELKSHESSTIIINVCETRLLISHKTLDNLAMHHGKTIHFRPCNTEEK